jgi:hypothetical protein
MAAVDLKPQRKRARRVSRDLVPLDKNTGAARFFDRMIRDVESDLGGRRFLSRIEGELVRAFAGSATALQYLNSEIVLGEAVGEIDLSAYATLASTMLRIGSKLGLSRRPREVEQTLETYLANRRSEDAAVALDERQSDDVNDDADDT